MWYDQTPKEYANALRYGATRSEATAARKRLSSCSWERGAAPYFDRQARRLRAMAILCDRATADRAGLVNFERLDDPTFPCEEETALVEAILAGR